MDKLEKIYICESCDHIQGTSICSWCGRACCNIQENKKLERALAIHIADLTGSCPMDTHDWEYSDGCNKVCKTDMPRYMCWLEYFKEQIK